MICFLGIKYLSFQLVIPFARDEIKNMLVNYKFVIVDKP